MNRFEDLQVWQASRELANIIYRVTGSGVFSKDFALRDQIRRAAISPMSNIAEGFDWDSRKVFIRHLRIAKGSTGEVKSQLYLASDLDYIDQEDFSKAKEVAENVSRQLRGFINYLSE